MPEFMVMILADEANEAKLAPSEIKALVEGHSAYERSLRAAAAYVDGGRLRPSAEGRRVSVRGGATRVEAGPFADAPVGGFYLVKADDLDAAVALTEACPLPPGTEVDVRPLVGGVVDPEKSTAKGKVFAFIVRGSARDERGWDAVMDRINDSRGADFDRVRVLGGVRLKGPSHGRKVVASAISRAVFDGPFLESKEVIGGLFFRRMPGIDEAVSWASGTEFVRLGAVEIRELWRS